MRLPPLNALRVFEAASRLGSFTLAGRELCVTHGAVSQQIRRLEEHLGTSLFLRQGNRIELTPAGQAIYENARRGLEVLAGIPQVLHQGDGLRGEVTVSAPPGLIGHRLVHHLADFHSRFKDLRLRLIPSNEDREVHSRDIDICIRYGNGAWSGRNVELLADIWLFPVCSPGLLQQGQGLDHPEDLRHFPILCADDGYEWDTWLGSVGLSDDLSDQRHHLGNALNTTEACCHGFGVALCGNISSAHYLREGKLIRPFPHQVRAANSLFLITRQDIGRKLAAYATAGWIRDLFRSVSGPLAPPQ